METLEGARRGKHRFRIVAVGGHEPGPGVLGRLGVPLRIPELGEPEEELADQRLGAGGRLDGLLEHRCPLPLRVPHAGQTPELLPHAGVGGVGQGRARQGVEGVLGIVDAVLVDVGDAQEQRNARAPVAHVFELDLEHASELGPAALGVVKRLEQRGDALPLGRHGHEPLERFLCAKVRRVLLENPFVEVDRRRRLVELLLVQLAELEGELEGVLPLGPVELLLEQRRQVRPPLGPPVEPLDGPPRGEVLRLELEHLLVGADGSLRVVEDLLVEEAHLQEQLELRLAVDRLNRCACGRAPVGRSTAQRWCTAP